MRRSLVAAACAGLLAGSPAAAALYQGEFSADGGFITGWFQGEDRDGDAQISRDELTAWNAQVSNLNGGPGQFQAPVLDFADFLFQDAGNGLGALWGVARYAVAELTCGGWYLPPCDDAMGDEGGPAPFALMARSFAPILMFSAPVEHRFSADRLSFTVLSAAPVPLPAGLPLMAAGFGALAGLRRRRT